MSDRPLASTEGAEAHDVLMVGQCEARLFRKLAIDKWFADDVGIVDAMEKRAVGKPSNEQNW